MTHNELPPKEPETPLQIAEKLWGMVSSDKYPFKPIEEKPQPDYTKEGLIRTYGLSPDDDLSGTMVLDGLGGEGFTRKMADGTHQVGWCHLHVGGPHNNLTRYTHYITLTYNSNDPEAGALRLRTIIENDNDYSDTTTQYSVVDDYGQYTKQLQCVERWIESSFNHKQDEGRRGQEADSVKRGCVGVIASWVLRKLGVRQE